MSFIEILNYGEPLGNTFDNVVRLVSDSVISKPKKEIQLRDYQNECVRNIYNGFSSGLRSLLVVLATGLGKTVLFSKIIDEWKEGRVLVLVHLEELLQNAYTEISEITGEIIGIERGKDRQDGERVVVGTVQTVALRLERFSRKHFSLIIIDEAHHASANIYRRILDYFSNAKVIGLTATDRRADGKPLPFSKCVYRMGIKEGVESGYLVPIRGERVIIDAIDLTRVRKNKDESDFDDSALDGEMVKGAAAIADVIYNTRPFDKGILFFPGCASAKLTCEFLNKKSSGLSIYIDGKIIGDERRRLVRALRDGESNWLCNVGIATEGFNWPEATVVGMCAPTLSRSAYVQRAGRGTRPETGILGGFLNPELRKKAILNSSKPYMTILDFVGISANLNLVDYESFLDDSPLEENNEQGIEREKEEDQGNESDEGQEGEKLRIAGSGFVSRIQSKTLHSIEEFDPLYELTEKADSLKLKTEFDPDDCCSIKQYELLKKYGIDDFFLTRRNAQKCIGFIAQRKFMLTKFERGLLRKLYNELLQGTQ